MATVEYNFNKPLEQFTKSELTGLVNIIKGPYTGRISQNGYQDRINQIGDNVNMMMSNNNYPPLVCKNFNYVENFIDNIIVYYNSASTTLIVNQLYKQIKTKGVQQ